eukprot:CAMPEP_0168368198 /NCGR_PEP_ID=MMETSP0228-20121227/6128_1 /TAXON_ID=133427 /ORGANISM="Protoceratium reticulatum, Strain CCCM 535 (=CCMP 1889)" /LENGTH=635 /DNA_ID=CAMNT_0008381039 /DNA_START=79 /DNA_END=1982 /DNA_ORIENTATION=+
MAQKLRERAACEARGECPFRAAAATFTPCAGGMAGEYPCHDVDLLAFVPLLELGTSLGANDIWGWTDPDSGKEYAVVGLFDGTSFVDVTVPTNPIVVGFMKTQTEKSVWRDIKVFSNHAFVVSEAAGHGMQVFDLTRLRQVPREDSLMMPAGRIQAKFGACLGAQPLPWTCLDNTTAASETIQCTDGRECRGWSCCAARGLKRIRCPPEAPIMCAADDACGGGKDHCCSPALGEGRDACGQAGRAKCEAANATLPDPYASASMQTCGEGSGGQVWHYDGATGLIRSHDASLKLCLAAEMLGGAVRLQPCDTNTSNWSGHWRYDRSSSQLMSTVGKCLATVGEPSAVDSGVQLSVCDSLDPHQWWSLSGALLPMFAPDAVYSEIGSSHNVVINERTATAYVVGSKTCRGGLHMVDIASPKEPEHVGCFAQDNYTHDAQCVVYRGPDVRFHGREVCFNYNEDTLTIVDVTDREAPLMLSRVGYNTSYYTHQGWLDQEQEFLFMNDELDEAKGPNNRTRTLIWDVRLLDSPRYLRSFYSARASIDHNLYVDGRAVFESNYCAGLRVLAITPSAGAQGAALRGSSAAAGEGPSLEEVGFFDVDPQCDEPRFRGTWSNYPYLRSGAVVATSIERGLFVLA